MAKQTLGSVFVGVGVTLAATLAVVMGCGGGSGATRPGSTGGTTGTGTGGTTGTGGAGGATSAGTGGTSSTATLNCSPGVNPASPMLTTFTSSGTTPDWNNVSGKWGTTGNLTGSVYAYQGSKSGTSAFKASVDTTAGVLNIGTAAGTGVTGGMIAAGDYAGGGLSFSQCVNTTTYTGVTFTLSGTAGGCDVYFQAQTFDEQGASNGGGCPSTASCYSFPQLKVVSAPADPTGTAITVKFTDLMGGEPDAGAAIAMQLVGLQFQLQSTSPVGDAAQTGCSNVELTIDNVAFTE
jgi:hypothetical protein